jgi:DNA-directed RNA polymerase III subunit RPC4
VRVKNEDDSYAGSSGRSGGGGPSIKREDGGYVSSSEEEDDKEFPRRDIDLIEISDDENESKDNVVSTQRHSRATLPVRIGRKEHQERAFGINTDASTESSAKTVAQAEATGQGSASESTVRKGKGKARDMEITGERKPFRGVWQDGDDADVAIKAEVISDDENMGDAEQVGIADSLTRPAEKLEPPSPGAERKPKPKIKSIAEPVLQTEEDRAEWARFQTNLQHIRAELGPDESSTADGSGDVQMAESGNNVKKPTVRDNNVYLFQIPPLMPELLTDSIKKEPSDEQSSLAAPTPVPGPVQAANPGPKVKLEEGGFSDPSAKTSDGPRFASGMVGKLRVRQSGRTTLDWGGTSYELTPGNRASFLQEVVSVRIDAEKDRVVPEDAGDAISFGRVKGKFVVVPDWTSMLGQ